MSRVGSIAAVAVITVVVTALVVVSTVGSLGSVIAFAGGGLVVLGAAVGRLWLAAVPVAIAAGLAVLVVTAPSPDLEDWTPAIVTVLVFLGVGGALCVGEQVVDVPKGPVGGRHLPEPAPVLRHDVPSVPSEPLAHLAPAATVAHARVQQDDRRPTTPPEVTDECRAGDRDLQRLERHGASLLSAALR